MFASKDLFFSKPSGYQISRSVRLRSSASAYFNRTPASATNQKTLTWSGWVKRGSLGTTQILLGTADSVGFAYNVSAFGFIGSTDILRFVSTGNTGGSILQFDTTAVFRDPSAWYHIVLYVDTTQATNTNGIRIYVNGVNQAGTYAAYTQNTNTFYNSTIAQYIGRYSVLSPAAYFDGYMTEVNFIDGQALTPSSFGETNAVTGVWQPKKYAGTYGTNGFYLNFSDNSNNTATTIGKDYSGNGNNWTPNNISVTNNSTYDSMLDVPTLFADGGNGRGNYPVLNVLRDKAASLSVINGNLTFGSTAATWNSQAASILIPPSGKWYWECEVGGTGNEYMIGITGEQSALSGQYPGSASGYGYYRNGQKFTASTGSAYGASYTSGDVIGVAVDVDAGTLTFYKNGTSQGVAFSSGISSNPSPSFAVNGTTASNLHPNFGQRPFAYTPPTGFVALNTQNLPTPTISNGANYMAATTYTGNGTTQSVSNAVNGVSMQPDFVWLKNRGAVGEHGLYDSVRGVTLRLRSNVTSAEDTISGVTAFNVNGFSLGADYNGSSATFVGWQWNAGGSTVTNTSGSISAQVRANPTAGFSVVTYTGTGANATVGHGLGVAPKMVIVKGRSAATNWVVYNSNLTSATFYLSLNQTIAQTSAATVWNSTTPTSTVFSIGTDASVNTNTATYVAYCFSEVAGYSKFGSYTGNGSTDGPFVFTNMRPRFVMIKRSDAVGSWYMIDTSRATYNVVNPYLIANGSNTEATDLSWDILSNGFKLRSTYADINTSGGTFIFMAFAENPFKNSLAR